MSTQPTADQIADRQQEIDLDYCGTCGSQKLWKDCWNCEDGYSHHDCGEDCCACLHPEDNVTCDICRGHGGFTMCARCHPENFDDE